MLDTQLMDDSFKFEKELHGEIEALKVKFPNTQELYREVCALLFFRYGTTPTANKLYQLVRKGSMSAPSEALGNFWSDLREKSRVRIEHPDLPEELKNIAGVMIGDIWAKAQGKAQESFEAQRSEAQSAIQEAETRVRDAEADRDTTRKELLNASTKMDKLQGEIRELDQALAGEMSTRLSIEQQLAKAHLDSVEQQKRMDVARQDFATELEKLRVALKQTEDRYHANESRALLEIDRERTISIKLQKELELARGLAIKLADKHRDEIHTLQGEIGNQKQNLGFIEGELRSVSTAKEILVAELSQERAAVRDLSSRLSTEAQESKNWQQKFFDAKSVIESLTKQKKSKKAVV